MFKKPARKTELNVLWRSTDFPSGLSVFLSVLCVFLCVWLWWVKTRLSFAVGFPEWTAPVSLWKTNGKDSSEACAIAYQNCAVYSVVPSGMTSHSRIVQFNWECIGPLTLRLLMSYIYGAPSKARNANVVYIWTCSHCREVSCVTFVCKHFAC